MEPIDQVRNLCELELSRAKSLIEDKSGKKFHQPTIEVHRGILLICQKILALLDGSQSRQYNRAAFLAEYRQKKAEGFKVTHVEDESINKIRLQKEGEDYEIRHEQT